MTTMEEILTLEKDVMAYFGTTHKMNHQVDFRQDELEGILQAYQAQNDVAAQVQRQYFLNGGAEA